MTGPLRLELRPLVASLSNDDGTMTTAWDVFHNVSPADKRGHFLLLPTLSDPSKNWRGQTFQGSDCQDMVHLAASIEPAGSLLLGFNSVGAGASQNHIHCHAWPSPPVPLLRKEAPSPSSAIEQNAFADSLSQEDVQAGWNCYAVTKLATIHDFYDLADNRVEVSYLKYPVFCVQLSSLKEDSELLARALEVTLKAIGNAPFNIGFLNRLEDPHSEEETQQDREGQQVLQYVDVFVFARSKERSRSLPSLKLGISEMMGVFHAQSDEELELLLSPAEESAVESYLEEDSHSHDDEGVENGGIMKQALQEVSYEDEGALWTSITENLADLDRELPCDEIEMT